VVRAVAPPESQHGGFVGYAELDEATADEVIAEQLAFFRADGRRAEWKVFGTTARRTCQRDLSPQVSCRRSARRWSGARWTTCCGHWQPARCRPASSVREADLADDLDGIIAMHEAVWGTDYGWMRADLAHEKAVDPRGSASTSRSTRRRARSSAPAGCGSYRGTDFAGLWGGSTLAAYRGSRHLQGAGRCPHRAGAATSATVRAGRRVARQRADLRRLGLQLLTWTQPYVWTPDTGG
jgi:hypothetical protein